MWHRCATSRRGCGPWADQHTLLPGQSTQRGTAAGDILRRSRTGLQAGIDINPPVAELRPALISAAGLRHHAGHVLRLRLRAIIIRQGRL